MTTRTLEHSAADARLDARFASLLEQYRAPIYRLTAIRGLPPLHREVVLLTLEGLPQREIAEVLGITAVNVASRASARSPSGGWCWWWLR